MELPKRKPLRLKAYNYSSPHYYYVTICTHNKNCIFGMGNNLTAYGIIAEKELLNIPNHYPSVKVEKYIIMPNHIHAVISLGCHDNSDSTPPNLSTVIGLYKSGVSKAIHHTQPNLKVWQTSFYDKIIRNEKSLSEIYTYIENNPSRWNV